jgi:adenine C2-methylase RlmN of 23S rRNA A2503 and tRNA A37
VFDVLHSVDSSGLEEQEQDFVIHHHYIACKNYDRTIMNKLSSFRNPKLWSKSIQQQLEQNFKNKRVMLVEDEADIAMTFKIVLESDAGLKVDSFMLVLYAQLFEDIQVCWVCYTHFQSCLLVDCSMILYYLRFVRRSYLHQLVFVLEDLHELPDREQGF